jgi:GAF domain-containing protein
VPPGPARINPEQDRPSAPSPMSMVSNHDVPTRTRSTVTGRTEAFDEATVSADGREQQLAAMFVALADSHAEDFDVVEALDLLVTFCVDTLHCDGAGVLLGDLRGRLAVMASAGEWTRAVDVVQLRHNEGPGIDCYRNDEPVVVHDVTQAIQRWPRFAPLAIRHGVRGVHALPMSLRQDTIGALCLYGRSGVPLALDDIHIARSLAETAAIGILQQRALQASNLLSDQLQTALNSRIVIEQAKGIISARVGVDLDTAFRSLLQHARANNLRLSDVAQAIATRSIDPTSME